MTRSWAEHVALYRLRAMIEKPHKCVFWGANYTITPRLLDKVFGDGKQLCCITPLATRPNYFVVRVDSGAEFDVHDILDDIADAAEEEYGHYDSESDDEYDRTFPVVDWGMGACWGERFTPEEWKE